MRIAVLCERRAGARRVAVTPEATAALVVDGHSVVVETGAGAAAGMPDDAYLAAGASIAPDPAAAIGEGGVVVSVNGPTDGEALGNLGADHVVVGLFDPVWRPDVAVEVAATGATMLALDLVPRSTRAQAVDVLSSQATVAGVQSVLLAAGRRPWPASPGAGAGCRWGGTPGERHRPTPGRLGGGVRHPGGGPGTDPVPRSEVDRPAARAGGRCAGCGADP